MYDAFVYVSYCRLFKNTTDPCVDSREQLVWLPRYRICTQFFSSSPLVFLTLCQFPVWHRWFVWLREVTLREQCGYNGPTPYVKDT